jgi:hypothetical protein
MVDQQIMAEIKKNDPEYNTLHRLPSQPQPAHLIQFTGLLTDYPKNLQHTNSPINHPSSH